MSAGNSAGPAGAAGAAGAAVGAGGFPPPTLTTELGTEFLISLPIAKSS